MYKQLVNFTYYSQNFFLFSAFSVRSRVITYLAKKFSSLNKAEENFHSDVDAYLMEESSKQPGGHSNPSLQLHESSSTLNPEPTAEHDNLVNTPGLDPKGNCSHQANALVLAPTGQSLDKSNLEGAGVEEIMINQLIEKSSEGILQKIADKAFHKLAIKNGINSNPGDFASNSVMAMKRLQAAGKNNLLYKFAECIARNRPGSQECLMPLDKMPFGLIEYQLEFFTCTNSDQVLCY